MSVINQREFLQFTAEFQERLESALNGMYAYQRDAAAVPDELLRFLHTFKGAARTIGLDKCAACVHCCEGLIGQSRDNSAERAMLLELAVEALEGLASRLTAVESGEQVEEEADLYLSKLQLFVPEGETASPVSAGPARAAAPRIVIAPFDCAAVDGELLNDFLTEANDQIENAVTAMLALEQTQSRESLNEAFRAIHTLKGGAGIVGIDPLCQLAHKLETVLDLLREGTLGIGAELIDLLLHATDLLKEIITRLNARADVNALDLQECLGMLVAAASGETVGRPLPPPAAGPAAQPAADNTSAVKAAVEKPAAPDSGKGQQKFLRVDVEKLDASINQMGELVIERIRLEQEAAKLFDLKEHFRARREEITELLDQGRGQEQLREQFFAMVDRVDVAVESLTTTIEHFRLIAGNLQESVMKMRLIPVSQVFNRFPRLVRDISREVGKEINLEMLGMETEIDKSVCEQLVDPMIHIIRNSLDHGIESPAEREAAGKPPAGVITIRAYYKGDNVIIEVSDDGKGIDAEKVLATAVKKGVLTAEEGAALDERERVALIFRPGFSTKAEVSQLSGRGVGMDVVATTVARLKGLVDVRTEVGAGSTMTLSLPLSLAIVNVLLFTMTEGVRREQMLCVPLYAVQETLMIEADDIRIVGGRQVIELRGEVIPMLHVNNVFALPRGRELSGRCPTIMLTMAEERVGLIVGKLNGKQEIVQKSLGTLLHKVPYLTGATIMGDGTVVPIIDPAAVIRDLAKLAGDAMLPCPTRTQSPAPVETTTASSRVPRILIVDDSTTVASVLAGALSEAGFEVVVAEDGVRGLELAQEQVFDLFSVDLLMPRMDGFTLCEKLRQMVRYHHTPIMVLTGKATKEDKVRGFSIGVDEYIVKPVDRELYVTIIRRLLALPQA